ncbi:MAG TPA: NRDE family protein [Steroidobacteraceae bacterium]|nr:NRDE family protein [Steroidobacteraceae bacterium]
MCLLVLAWQAHPRYRLIVAANRDEYHERPAAPLGRWAEPPGILAGRDLRAAGTWLGLDPARRFGVVTNFRELQQARPGAPSRGSLIPRFLSGAADAAGFFRELEGAADGYSGFNLLLADRQALWYGSNRALPFARALPPGVYGLSNELLDTPWPKLVRVKSRFEAWLAGPAGTAAGLFELLADRTQALPTDAPPPAPGGLPREWERVLSAPFVVHPTYGTRCSTVLMLAADGAVRFAERRFDAAGAAQGETEFRLNAADWP